MQIEKRVALVGGFPRSGTRNFCDLISAIPCCELSGEFEDIPYKNFACFAGSVDERYTDRWMQRGYNARRLESILETYRLFSKTSANRRSDWQSMKVVGFKKPLVETLHSSTKTLFKPSVEFVTHFYCFRNVFDNFNSLAGAFGYDVKGYARRISASIDAIKAMSNDDFFRISPLFLDDYVASDERPEWIKAHIFDVLGVEISQQECVECIESVQNRNRTPSDKRRAGVTEEEEHEMSKYTELWEGISWLEDYFEVDISSRRCGAKPI